MRDDGYWWMMGIDGLWVLGDDGYWWLMVLVDDGIGGYDGYCVRLVLVLLGLGLLGLCWGPLLVLGACFVLGAAGSVAGCLGLFVLWSWPGLPSCPALQFRPPPFAYFCRLVPPLAVFPYDFFHTVDIPLHGIMFQCTDVSHIIALFFYVFITLQPSVPYRCDQSALICPYSFSSSSLHFDVHSHLPLLPPPPPHPTIKRYIKIFISMYACSCNKNNSCFWFRINCEVSWKWEKVEDNSRRIRNSAWRPR